ncbi:MAG: class I SAM-dependent methyltransferase [Dehalococcoidia bacterium]|nr:class I SAM-dependent methyltransferase [Dehalococcoidia bacterium]
MTVIKVLSIILGLFALWQVLIRVFRKLFHFPAPAFIGSFLDSNYRRKLQPPEKIIQRSGIRKGTRVLEVGCGSGAYTTFVARAVGREGRVYALDIQPEMLQQLESKLARPENEDIRNVELVNSSAYELPFDDDSLDLVYMVTVLQEIPDRSKALQQVRRVLKPGGILSVTEWLPDPDYPWKSTTIKIGREAGLVLDEAPGNFWHYTVRFRKPQNSSWALPDTG